VLKCKGWQTDPNAYIYFTIREQNWVRSCEAIGKPQWAEDLAYATARARQDKIFDIFAEIEKWLADKNKFEAVEILRKFDVPCGPVQSMKEIEDDPFLRANGSIVEVEEEKRGKYLTVGSPINSSAHEGPSRRRPEVDGFLQCLGSDPACAGRPSAGPCRQ
jgi:formyl-CoA transferase